MKMMNSAGRTVYRLTLHFCDVSDRKNLKKPSGPHSQVVQPSFYTQCIGDRPINMVRKKLQDLLLLIGSCNVMLLSTTEKIPLRSVCALFYVISTLSHERRPPYSPIQARGVVASFNKLSQQ